jgi:hypothetical protein
VRVWDAAEIMVGWETMLRVREPTATSWRFPTKTALYCDFTTTEGDRGRLDLAEGDCDWVTRRAEAGVFGRADLLEGACLVRRDLCAPLLRPDLQLATAAEVECAVGHRVVSLWPSVSTPGGDGGFGSTSLVQAQRWVGRSFLGGAPGGCAKEGRMFA